MLVLTRVAHWTCPPGPDGYSNGPGTGAVIAPPSLRGPDGAITTENHGGHAYGAFTSDYD
jgi:hypothetical protein